MARYKMCFVFLIIGVVGVTAIIASVAQSSNPEAEIAHEKDFERSTRVVSPPTPRRGIESETRVLASALNGNAPEGDAKSLPSKGSQSVETSGSRDMGTVHFERLRADVEISRNVVFYVEKSPRKGNRFRLAMAAFRSAFFVYGLQIKQGKTVIYDYTSDHPRTFLQTRKFLMGVGANTLATIEIETTEPVYSNRSAFDECEPTLKTHAEGDTSAPDKKGAAQPGGRNHFEPWVISRLELMEK